MLAPVSTMVKAQKGAEVEIFCCDPNQMQGLNPVGHTVTAEGLCLVSLASRPQVNIGKPDP